MENLHQGSYQSLCKMCSSLACFALDGYFQKTTVVSLAHKEAFFAFLQKHDMPALLAPNSVLTAEVKRVQKPINFSVMKTVLRGWKQTKKSPHNIYCDSKLHFPLFLPLSGQFLNNFLYLCFKCE